MSISRVFSNSTKKDANANLIWARANCARRVYLLHYPSSETKTYSLVLMCYLTPKPSPPFDPIRKKHSLTITPQSRMLPDDQPSWKHGHFSCQTSNRNPRLVITLFHLPLFLSESWKIVASGKNVANTWFGAFRHFFEKKEWKKCPHSTFTSFCQCTVTGWWFHFRPHYYTC